MKHRILQVYVVACRPDGLVFLILVVADWKGGWKVGQD